MNQFGLNKCLLSGLSLKKICKRQTNESLELKKLQRKEIINSMFNGNGMIIHSIVE